ncbi:MAG: hypothetical protein ACR2PG_20765 [Hyphomicrobiaceae bacterium]
MDRVNYSSQRDAIDSGHEGSDWVGEAVSSKLELASNVNSSAEPLAHLRTRLEGEWPEWSCRFADAIDDVNARLSRQCNLQLHQEKDAPQWESCLGQPCDDIADDGYLTARWRLISPSTLSGELAQSGTPIIPSQELRIALQHTCGQDSIFIEFEGNDWVRLASSMASPETICSAITDVMKQAMGSDLV